MAKQIARLLKTDMSDSSDLRQIAKMLQSKGRGKDTILAHITPKEAQMLKEMGGRGSVNPDTGLLEYEPVDDFAAPVDPPAVLPAAPAQTFDTNMQVDAPSQAYPTVDVAAPAAAMPQGFTPAAYDMALNRAEPSTFPANIPAPSTAVTPEQKAAADYAESLATGGQKTPQQDTLARLAQTLGGKDALMRLGLAGGLGVMGAMQQRRAAGQAAAAQGEQQKLATPYQAQGQQLVRAAQAGELTPQAMQSYKAAQAQLAQGVESRGGVGAQQATAQLEALRQSLLQNQYDYGLKVSQIGDNIALGAIRTGLQLDQQLNQATQGFYTNLAFLVAGTPTQRQVPAVAPTTP